MPIEPSSDSFPCSEDMPASPTCPLSATFPVAADLSATAVLANRLAIFPVWQLCTCLTARRKRVQPR